MQAKNKKNIVYVSTLGLHESKRQGLTNKDKSKIEEEEYMSEVVDAKMEAEEKVEEPTLAIIDAGWGNTKFGWVDSDGVLKKDVMPSRVKVVDDGMELFQVNNQVCDFRHNERLTNTENAATKGTDSHRLLVQKALWEIHKKTGAKKFNVMVGCGLDSYIEDGGKTVKKHLLTKAFKIGPYKEDQVELQVNDLKVSTETLSGVNALGAKFKNRTVIAIDIGYLNWSMVGIYDMIPDLKKDRVIVTANGMSKLLADIVREANNGTTTINGKKWTINDIEVVDRTLRNIEAHADKKEFFKTGIVPFCQRIEYELNNFFGVNEKMADLTLAFMGGGSKTLKAFLEEYFKKKEYETLFSSGDPMFSNLEGMHKKAVREFKKVEPKKEESK